MAKAKFSRDGEGGYLATYRVNGRDFTASLTRPNGKVWGITSGFAADPGRVWDKLGRLKGDWATMCELEASPRPSGPPKLSKPPKPCSPPSLKPKPPALGGGDLRAGSSGHQHADPDAFAAYLRERGKLLGPTQGCAEFRCSICGAHISDWERRQHAQFIPPCRCKEKQMNPSAYLPRWEDPIMWEVNTSEASMRPSPLGALEMVYNWMRARPKLCTFKGVLMDPFKTVLLTLHAETGRPEYSPELRGNDEPNTTQGV